MSEVDNDYLEQRRAFMAMAREYKMNLLNGEKCSIEDIAEKHKLNREPFLSDLRAIKKAMSDSEDLALKEKKANEYEYQKMLSTPKQTVNFLASTTKKNEVKAYNIELEQKTKKAKNSLLDDLGVKKRIEMLMNKRFKSIWENREAELRKMKKRLDVLDLPIFSELQKKALGILKGVGGEEEQEEAEGEKPSGGKKKNEIER